MTNLCQQCKSTLEDEGIPVGHWRFCQQCFASLTTTTETPNDVRVDDGGNLADTHAKRITKAFFTNIENAQTTKLPSSGCRICEEASEDGRYIDVVGIKVCQRCYDKMLPNSASVSPKERVSTPRKPEPPPEPVRPVGQRTHACASCSRKIAPKGAYEVKTGYLCPDCYYRQEPPG